MLWRKDVMLMVALLFFGSAYAQHQLGGVVLDATTHHPIAGATVVAGSKSYITSTQGTFHFTSDTSAATVHITHLSYLEKEVVIRKANQSVVLTQTVYPLEGFTVRAFEFDGTPNTTPGSITALNSEALQQYDNTSALNALNTIPGVKMESRGPGGSRRIAIRGSILRSPFGVRNVKAYWNGIPITSPDGSTPLEVIDTEEIDAVEVIRGPASSIYGSGYGGTLLFNTAFPKTTHAATTFTVGEYGLTRFMVKGERKSEKNAVTASYVNHRYEGYRGQEFVRKDQVSFHSKHLGNKNTLMVHGYGYQGAWGLPGAIDSAAVAEDPTQALPYSVTANASVMRKRARLGVVNQHYFSNRFSNTTTLFGNITTKENPYGTSPFFNGYKLEDAFGYGARSVFKYVTGTRESWLITGGAEYRKEHNDFYETGNDNGAPSGTGTSADIVTSELIGFVKADLVLPEKTVVSIGASITLLDQKLDDNRYQGNRTYDPFIAPRIALLHPVYKKINLHGSASMGTSPPTVWEMQITPTRYELAPEVAFNLEAGIKGQVWHNRIGFDIVRFSTSLDSLIVPRVADFGDYFVNAGRAQMKGWEGALTITPINDTSGTVTRLELWGSITLNDFIFKEYRIEVSNNPFTPFDDFSGNRITGTPEQMAAAGLRLHLINRLQWNTTLHHVGSIPINDENTIFAAAYQTLSTKVNYRFEWNQWQLNVFAGGENLTDELYSSFLQLNGFGGRYYNPSPGRYFYGGIGLKFSPNI